MILAAAIIIAACFTAPAFAFAATFCTQPAPHLDQDQGNAQVHGERDGFLVHVTGDI